MSVREANKPIVLFDGVCNLCSAVVVFTIERDPKRKFMVAPLQSDTGQALLKKFNLSAERFDSFVLIEDDRCYSRSTATLRVVRRLTGLWPVLYALIIIPRPIRDWIYDFVAKNRYRWFGKKDQCMVPTADVKSRFLE
jgi:predicted DCC family thiol-disulfide oxidoreductase YuxK